MHTVEATMNAASSPNSASMIPVDRSRESSVNVEISMRYETSTFQVLLFIVLSFPEIIVLQDVGKLPTKSVCHGVCTAFGPLFNVLHWCSYFFRSQSYVRLISAQTVCPNLSGR